MTHPKVQVQVAGLTQPNNDRSLQKAHFITLLLSMCHPTCSRETHEIPRTQLGVNHRKPYSPLSSTTHYVLFCTCTLVVLLSAEVLKKFFLTEVGFEPTPGEPDCDLNAAP